MLRQLINGAKASESPSLFLFFSLPLLLVVIGILVAAFQINQELYDQQDAIIRQLSHAAVRHTAQLQREHLRLSGMIEGTRAVLDETAFETQKELLESRMNVMKFTVLTSAPPPKVHELYTDYAAGWEGLQPLMEEWQRAPQDEALKRQILDDMAKIELSANGILILAQSSFEDHMSSWAQKSRFLNQLLILGVFSFALIILVIFYMVYLYIRSQAAAESILLRSEQRLRSIIEAVPDAVYRMDRDGIYTDYKAAINETYSLPREAIVGKSIYDVLPVDAAAMVKDGIDRVLLNGEQLILSLPLPDIETAEIHHYEARLLPGGTNEVQMVARDVTLVRQQEEATLQAQKLESLGVLAGGIAHDFNNLLTGMLGQASLAVAKLERGLSAIDNIQKVILSAERAADLTRQLLAYTGKGKFQIGPLDMNQLIRDTTSLMETTLPSHVRLDLKLEHALPLVQSDRAQIQQVLMNLFINAIEALPDDEGSILITTETRQIEEESFANLPTASGERRSGILKSGTHVVIQVTDTGSGMEQTTLNRIFDPFFSTKPKGHGLGLSATLGIVHTHQGALQVQSQCGVGTVFTILLPALTPIEIQGSSEVASTELPVPREEIPATVLVIDDEAHIRELATDILAEKKYKVMTAAHGTEGLDLFRTYWQCIGVVLLDLKMPGMSGIQTFQQLRKIQPDLKIIFTSGYSESEVSTLISESDRITFLAKPYVAESLTRQVANLLSR